MVPHWDFRFFKVSDFRGLGLRMFMFGIFKCMRGLKLGEQNSHSGWGPGPQVLVSGVGTFGVHGVLLPLVFSGTGT